ncbi:MULTISPECIES: hypothetical protein [Pseudomonas]|uniref:hypothetical protein n=1 Tax=Pseudomonas TaxID=286 RepID=UPI00143DBA8A|nr:MULTISPECIES: hypothetical protein [Pseudomonas]WEX16562.1 hypothetical protein P2T68_04325 [Pseudomonas sp. G11]
MKRQVLATVLMSVLASSAFALPAAEQATPQNKAQAVQSSQTLARSGSQEDENRDYAKGAVAENGRNRLEEKGLVEGGAEQANDRAYTQGVAENGRNRLEEKGLVEGGADRLQERNTIAEGGADRLQERNTVAEGGADRLQELHQAQS